MNDPRHFVLVIEDVDGEAEHGSWREYVIRQDSPRRTAKLICPAGVTEADFAKRVQLAVAALNDVKPTARPELPPCWDDEPPVDLEDLGNVSFLEPEAVMFGRSTNGHYGEGAATRAQAVARAWEMHGTDPWVDFADAQTRRADAAEETIAALMAERVRMASQLERTHALYFELDADDERELARIGAQNLEAAPLLVLSDDDGIELDDDDLAVWEVATGTGTPTAIAGYITGDQRGLVALHFAQDDEPGWLDGQYNETLWVRRCKPDPEPEPGQAIRVVVSRETKAEREP
jgi:hypothetical protein